VASSQLSCYAAPALDERWPTAAYILAEVYIEKYSACREEETIRCSCWRCAFQDKK
jgi:hypothetical protein